MEDTVDAPADPFEGITGDTEQTMDPGSSSPTTVEQVQLQVQTNSPDVSRDRNIGDTERPEYTDMSEIIEDTRSYTILGLETLLFTNSSSQIYYRSISASKSISACRV